MGNGLPKLHLPPLGRLSAAESDLAPAATHSPGLEDWLLCSSTTIAILLFLAPLLRWLGTGSVEKTLKLCSVSSWVVAVINGVVWMLFVTGATHQVASMELLIGFPVITTICFVMLSGILGRERAVKSAAALWAFVLPSIAYVIFSVRFNPILPQKAEIFFGYTGLISVCASHAFLLTDLPDGSDWTDTAIAFLNITANLAQNIITLYTLMRFQPDDTFLVYSAFIGVIGGAIEVMFMVIRVVQKKFFEAVPAAEDEQPQNQNGAPQNQDGAPQNQDGAPQDGAPQNQDGAPQNQDGAPQNQDGEIPEAQDLHPPPQNELNEDGEIENADERIDIVVQSAAAAAYGSPGGSVKLGASLKNELDIEAKQAEVKTENNRSVTTAARRNDVPVVTSPKLCWHRILRRRKRTPV